MSFTPDDLNKLQDYLCHVIAGSIVGQIAAQRRLHFEDLAGDSSLLRVITDELTELGIDPSLLAQQSLHALVALFAQESNADLIASQFTKLLWSILGDPKNGGLPPEIYRRAGVAMHLALLGILDPSLIEKRARS